MSYILLVDDQPESITMAARYLVGKGHRTAVLVDGREAIARIREEPPDILVTDILLPLADGFQIVREFHQNHGRERGGVVMLTYIAADREPLRDWERLAVDGYVLCHPDAATLAWQIVLAVEQLLHQRRAE